MTLPITLTRPLKPCSGMTGELSKIAEPPFAHGTAHCAATIAAVRDKKVADMSCWMQGGGFIFQDHPCEVPLWTALLPQGDLL